MGRFAVLALFVASVTSAHASFELLLVADNGAGTFATRKIHRFEARTGTYLGSFGGFSGNISNTFLRQSTGSLFVHDSSTVTEWDYNTGALKGTWNSPTFSNRLTVRPDGQRYALFDGFANFVLGNYPIMQSTNTTGTVQGSNYRSGLWYSQTDLMTYDGTNNVFRKFAMNSTGTIGTVTGTSGALLTGFGQMARNAGTNMLIMAGGAFVKQVEFNTMNSGQFASPFGTSTAASVAHNGFFIGGSNGTSGLVTYYDSLGFIRAQFGGSVLVNPVAMETVLAPEPGTMIALGAGLAAILRRRRSR